MTANGVPGEPGASVAKVAEEGSKSACVPVLVLHLVLEGGTALGRKEKIETVTSVVVQVESKPK